MYLHKNAHQHLDARAWPILRRQVEAGLSNWREPDAEIWEVRGQSRHLTSSKIMCWVAVDRGAKLAREFGEDLQVKPWDQDADEIKATILNSTVDVRGVLTQHCGTSELDASLLLTVQVGVLPPTDSRMRATVLAIADELTQDGLVWRYRPGQTDDGFDWEEGSFTICSFWLVTALSEIGEYARSCALCEGPQLRPVRSSSTPRRSMPGPRCSLATSHKRSHIWR